MRILKSIVNLAIGEAIVLGFGREVLQAQDFDMPPPPQKKYLNEIDTIDQDQAIRQLFNNYEFNGNNYTDILNKHSAIPNTGKELKSLLMNEIPVEYMEAFNSVQDAREHPVFDYWDVAKFYQNDVSVKDLDKALEKAATHERAEILKYIYKASYKAWKREHKHVPKAFINKGNFKTLFSLSLIKRSREYFKNSERPVLLITYPTLDFNKALFSPPARKMIKDLSDTYDIYFATLENERALYMAIKKVKNIDLLIISGHGEKDRVILNDSGESDEDKSYIDTRDKELKRYLSKLSPDALIFINACNTGKGGKKLENLANNMAECAEGRKVIASREPFSPDEIIFKSKYPFDIDIPDKTYVAIKEK